MVGTVHRLDRQPVSSKVKGHEFDSRTEYSPFLSEQDPFNCDLRGKGYLDILLVSEKKLTHDPISLKFTFTKY